MGDLSIYFSFQSRAMELYDRLDAKSQRTIRAKYLKILGFDEPPSDPVEKYIFEYNSNSAFSNMIVDCLYANLELINKDEPIVVLLETYHSVCGGSSIHYTGINVYCLESSELVPINTDSLKESHELSVKYPEIDQDEKIAGFLNDLRSMKLCEATTKVH